MFTDFDINKKIIDPTIHFNTFFFIFIRQEFKKINITIFPTFYFMFGIL